MTHTAFAEEAREASLSAQRARLWRLCALNEMDGSPMHFYPHERIGLFIDGPNVYATSQALGFTIDYRRLLSEVHAL
jgi:hypothetical protein